MVSKKKKFQLEKHETIDECLKRMENEGYQPIRRIEKPFFKEGKNGPDYAGQTIIFEGILIENTND